MRRRSLSAHAEAIAERRPAEGMISGPLVTMVIVNRNDARLLQRLFAGLRDRTAYQDFNVVVSGDRSDDDLGKVLAAPWPFDVKSIHNTGNTTLLDPNDQGVEAATGDYILLMHDDVEPINPSWLGVLVDSLESDQMVVAAGSLLLRSERDIDRHLRMARSNLSVELAGIGFDWQDDTIHATHIDSGADPLRRDRTATRRRPGATTACLLVRRCTLEKIGGLSSEYSHGPEEWDLSLRLQEHGAIVIVGAAALLHADGTQHGASGVVDAISRGDSRQRFIERWGPRLSRDLRTDRVRHRGFWNPRHAARIGITHESASPDPATLLLADALRRRGWEVSLLHALADDAARDAKDLDVIVTTSPSIDWTRLSPHSIRVAWIRDRIDEWANAEELDRYLVVLLSEPTEANYVRELTGLDPVIFLPAGNYGGNTKSPLKDPAYALDVVVVGDRAEVDPGLAQNLEVAPDERLIIVGTGWEGDPLLTRYWRSPIDDEQLDKLIANAGVVFHPTTSRTVWKRGEAVLGTLAVGGLPATDSFELSQWLFDGKLPVITNRRDFRRVVDSYAHDPVTRSRKVTELSSAAAAEHTYDARAATLDWALDSSLSRPMVAINISPPNWKLATQGGDLHFARQFGRALRPLGFQTRVNLLPEWDRPSAQDADVVVHLRGLNVYVPKPGALNVLWVVSHPEDVTPAECERYDLVFVASHSFAAHLQTIVDVPVRPLLQATDPLLFHPVESHPELHTEVLFVGNARWPPRVAPRWAMELGAPLVIYGANWDNFPENRFVAGTYFPNEQLNKLYASANIVVNDHWPDMKAHGFLVNRLFDILSAGGFAISDHVDGIDRVFDGAVPTYRTKSDLAALLERFRDDPLSRARHALHGMQHVHRAHTFDARARDFVRSLAEISPSFPLDVAGSRRADLRAIVAGLNGETQT